jgi:predicted aconitase with swiveling domain
MLFAGAAQGEALVTDVPLSWWGGLNPHTGEIIDRRHPLSGQVITGRVLVFPFARGSSSTSSTMLETLRAGTAPAAILNSEVDPVVVLGVVVYDTLWGKSFPIGVLSHEDFARIRTGDLVRIEADGTVVVEPAPVGAASPTATGSG